VNRSVSYEAHGIPVGHRQYIVQAWELLRRYTVEDAKGLAQGMRDNAEKRRCLRTALDVALAHHWPEMGWNPHDKDILLGVLASDVRLAVRALRDWCDACDVDYIAPVSRVCCLTSTPAQTRRPRCELRFL
jgi:hypothetical protein